MFFSVDFCCLHNVALVYCANQVDVLFVLVLHAKQACPFLKFLVLCRSLSPPPPYFSFPSFNACGSPNLFDFRVPTASVSVNLIFFIPLDTRDDAVHVDSASFPVKVLHEFLY